MAHLVTINNLLTPLPIRDLDVYRRELYPTLSHNTSRRITLWTKKVLSEAVKAFTGQNS